MNVETATPFFMKRSLIFGMGLAAVLRALSFAPLPEFARVLQISSAIMAFGAVYIAACKDAA